ncbi:MAG: ABC transporter permease [Planctomycetes bacterium]|nr:ABC transporter permease [Planctomycetota bacterium]
MNRPTLRGLFLDALYQVLDNLGFRILFCLFLVPVLLSFVVSFRETSIAFFWCWEWDYAEFLRSATASSGLDAAARAEMLANVRESLLQGLVDVVIEWGADRFGLVFGIAAISFFVPQMLEKGAADVIFSKPVSRSSLFLSRYIGGLLFVGILSAFLVGGITLGLVTSSGWFDSGLLWSVLALMYGFAIFHAISCTIGVFTRNTIGAILLTLVFMPINCGLHLGWENLVTLEQAVAGREASAEEPQSGAFEFLKTGLTAYHVVAPKTGDAMRMARTWRRSLETQPEFQDSELGLVVAQAPREFRREPRSSFAREGLAWLAAHPDGAGEASWTLRSQALQDTGPRSALVKKQRKELGTDPVRSDISGRYADRFEWVEDRGGEKRLRRRWILQVGDRIVTLDYDAESTWARADERETAATAFLAGISIESEELRHMGAVSYERKFGWGGPWQFNAWFSLGTTLAFVAVVLALGLWKLRRIDF